MAEEAELRNVAAALYEAALQPEGWPSALSRFGDLIDGTWSVLGAFRRDGQAEFVIQDAAGDPAHFALFRDHYNQPQTNAAVPALLAADPGAILLREWAISDAEWVCSDLYREIYRPAGVYHGLGALVLGSATHLAIVGINRPGPHHPYTDRDLDLLRQGLPHLRSALSVFLKLTECETHKRAHEAIWDTLACGVVLLDDTGKISWTSQAATATLACADGLAVRNGSLAAANPSENHALQSLIRQTIAASRGRCLASGSSLSVSRHAPVRPLALLIAPIHSDQVFIHHTAAVVFVSDPERKTEPAPELLRRLYGLTSREAALAALLMRGTDLREAAEQLEVSVHTARTYLRFIFRKTETCRQSELVALLLRGPLGLR
jgi:DNA-binding NarL/FixJ family response regulator